MPNGNPAPGPLNSRYFRPVRGKETRARGWDLQFESTSLQQGVSWLPLYNTVHNILTNPPRARNQVRRRCCAPPPPCGMPPIV
jgi:hypothetical protein